MENGHDVKRAVRSGVCVSRYLGQRVLINGGLVTIRINEIRSGKVTLFIEAPRETRIERPDKEQDKLDRIRKYEVTFNC